MPTLILNTKTDTSALRTKQIQIAFTLTESILSPEMHKFKQIIKPMPSKRFSFATTWTVADGPHIGHVSKMQQDRFWSK